MVDRVSHLINIIGKCISLGRICLTKEEFSGIMKHFKTETKTFETVTHTTCDICGKDTDHEEDDSYTRRDVDCEYEHGNIWPDDYNCIEYKPDICSECFRTRIIPFIDSLLQPEVKPWVDATWRDEKRYKTGEFDIDDW